MASWLGRATWFQRISLLLLAGAALLWGITRALGDESGFGLVLFAVVLLLFAFRRAILWRVRNRLAITFLLFGVVPLVLLYLILQMTVVLVVAQVADTRVRDGLRAKLDRVQDIAQNLTDAASHNAPASLLQTMQSRHAGVRAIVRRNGQVVASGGDPAIQSPAAGFTGLFEAANQYYFGAHVRSADGSSDAFAYLPLNGESMKDIAPGVLGVPEAAAVDMTVNFAFSLNGTRALITQNGETRDATSPQLPPPKNSWDASIASLVRWPVRTASGKDDEILIPIVTRPSFLLAGLAGSLAADVAKWVLLALGGLFVLVELVSLISSFSLTRAVTRSVHDLYQGTQRVAKGDFDHPIPVRGKHQLSDLAASFNGMTAQIRHYIGEMRKKDKLESELEIARQVQARLFPRTVPELATLEIAGVCLPGRFVSGDYYDFVPLDARHTAIVLGDVSGKGVSAALLMASIQSSLHAQLKFSGAAAEPSLSTATLMGLISQQLYENTPPEKYATFFCSVYDDASRVLRYTNCGHLKPIVIRDGAVSNLEGDGMVVGLLPKVSYDRHEAAVQPGDLIAIFSDGIPEAENVAGQEFGEARLSELLAQHSAEPLDAIIQKVTSAVSAWIHDPEGQDDTTIVLLRGRAAIQA